MADYGDHNRLDHIDAIYPGDIEPKQDKMKSMPWLDKKNKLYAKRNTGFR